MDDLDDAVTVPPVVRRVLITTIVVGSTLALGGGLIWGTALLWRHPAVQVLLLILAGGVGVAAIAATRWVFERPWRSRWLGLGLLPALITTLVLLVR